jgi:hypothetical protein
MGPDEIGLLDHHKSGGQDPLKKHTCPDIIGNHVNDYIKCNVDKYVNLY